MNPNLFGNLVPPEVLTDEDKALGFSERTQEQHEIHKAIMGVLGRYIDKVKLKKFSLPPDNKVEWDGIVPAGAWFGQSTGSCVGANSANVILAEIAVENIIKKTGEELNIDWWWLYTYALGRHYMGEDTEGEGSYLGVQFKALTTDGIPNTVGLTLPEQYSPRDGARWLSSQTEMKGSSYREIDRQFVTPAKDHKLLDGVMIGSLDELKDALLTGPVGVASMFGYKGTYTKEGVTLADWNDRWAHNAGFFGMWNHPKLGYLYKWGTPSWGQEWFVWLTEKTVQKLIGDSGTELMVARDFQGVEEAGIDLQWLINLIMSLVP